MSKMTKETLFKPSTRASDKWEHTNSVSRSMTEAAEEARRKKTERLRKLRLEAQTDEEKPAEVTTPVRRMPRSAGKKSLAIKDE